MVIGDITTYIEIVIGVNTLSTVFWQSLNTLLDQSNIESKEVNDVLETKQGGKSRDEIKSNRKRILQRVDNVGRVIALLTAIVCLYLLLNPYLAISHWLAWVCLLASPHPVLIFYIIRYRIQRHYRNADEKTANELGFKDLVERVKNLNENSSD